MREQLKQLRKGLHEDINDYCKNNENFLKEKNRCHSEINVLYIDDEKQNLVSFSALFKREFHIYTAQTVDQAERIIDEIDEKIHVILCDERLKGVNGLEYLRQVKLRHPKIIRLLVSAFLDDNIIAKAFKDAGVFKVFEKPFQFSAIYEGIKDAYLEHLKLQLINRA